METEAIVATYRGEVIAVARYHHTQDSVEAEIAVVVEDRWQRRGIARTLFCSSRQSC